ncbi:sensor domain-containing diguanylate cyclase [Marilutibacter chinensis]|uniref:Diguanylate cyclase n=1 Tax=Marilutibacter chinensis TaxID=2912247 RepID=A0ABS9HNV1_9GAMM|nr:sensor domain-containing diguanylate cyclase [Lysobacter chinensis]MCF7220659.1 diguanylate cyclase [Lysobacter chinensis]
MDHSPTLTRKRLWLDRLLLAFLVGASAWLLLALVRAPGELSAIWIGNGILTGWLLSRPTRLWPGYVATGLAADVVAHLLSGDPVAYAAAIGASNVVEVLIVAGFVRRLVPDVGDARQWIRLGGIATSSTLAACAVSGVLAAATAVVVYEGSFLRDLFSWYAAHVVGMVIFATTTLVVHREGLQSLALSGRKRGSFIGIMLLLSAVAFTVFFFRYPLLFLAYPPLLLGAFRHGFAGVAVGVILLAVIGSVLTAMGYGPLWALEGIGAPERIALLQLYIAGGCLMIIPVALAMGERKRLTARLRDSEHRYRLLADFSHDLVVRMRPDGERLYVSPSARDMLGWEPAEMLGSRWSLMHPEDRDHQSEAMADVVASGRARMDMYRVRHKDGHYIWVEAVTQPIPSIDRKGEFDIISAARDVTSRVVAEQALEESRRELERLVRVDALTGLANRRQFDERISLALKRLRRHGHPLALIYLDVDHFKGINDTYGHEVGDEVLCAFARRLRENVRAIDLPARIGGDEFVVVVEDAAVPDAAEAIARKLVEAMAVPIAVDGTTLKITTSIGIAYTHASVDAKTLMSSADGALYSAKKAGRNRYCITSMEGAVKG